MIRDLKYALRMLFKAPGFTVIAILTLALGIGANSAIFSVIDAVLLRPLPFPKPNELVAIWSQVARENSEKETESTPDYVDLRDQSHTLSALAAFTRAGAVLNGAEESRQLQGLAVTSDIFAVLGVPPARVARRGMRRRSTSRSSARKLGSRTSLRPSRKSPTGKRLTTWSSPAWWSRD